MMEFEWNEHNISHIARHDVKPEDAEYVLRGNPLHVTRELRNGEDRTTYAGPDSTGRILIVTATPRGNRIRVVTAFTASKQIRAWYTTLRGVS